MTPKMRSHGINRHGTGINPHAPWQINQRATSLDYLQRYFYGWQESDYTMAYIVDNPAGMIARKYMLPDEDSVEECEMCYDPAAEYCGNEYCSYHCSEHCDGNC